MPAVKARQGPLDAVLDFTVWQEKGSTSSLFTTVVDQLPLATETT